MDVIVPPRRTEVSPSGAGSAGSPSAGSPTGGLRGRELACISDVVEQLLCDFGTEVSLPTVAEVVLRLNDDGEPPLPTLVGRARLELVTLLISRSDSHSNGSDGNGSDDEESHNP